MKIVKLPKYDIYINDSFSSYNEFFNNYFNSAFFVITDQTVFSIYKETLENKLNKKKLFWYILEPGDDSKTSENALKIIGFLFKNNAKRDDVLISFGGGVITDITGLVASIYMRGVNLVHIPTTIIGQIDSSIGGKTSVNHLKYKNIIGTFYDPAFVICETDYLKTLPEKEIINGLGELIKTGFIGDEEIIKKIELNDQKLLTPNIIKKAIDVKKEYVIEDYFDKSKRNILNFGHTIGHAVEAASNFQVTHGQAVIFGMVKALEVGISLKLTNPQVLKRLNDLINTINYKLPDTVFKDYEKFLYKDKKSELNGVKFVFLEDVLKPKVEIISWEKLKDELASK
ncbi:MAG: 3-dehydroquinate synthase [Acholeplasmataceae bacterium]|jgi:3-dehydroquinate synthase